MRTCDHFLPPGPQAEELRAGRELLNAGHAFFQMRLRLVAQGATHEVSEQVVQQLAQQMAEHDLAVGRTVSTVQERLMAHGLEVRQAQEAVAAARQKLLKRLRQAGAGNNRVYVAALVTGLVTVATLICNAAGLISLSPQIITAMLLLGIGLCFYVRARGRQPEVG